jgi:hypothetical protein
MAILNNQMVNYNYTINPNIEMFWFAKIRANIYTNDSPELFRFLLIPVHKRRGLQKCEITWLKEL